MMTAQVCEATSVEVESATDGVAQHNIQDLGAEDSTQLRAGRTSEVFVLCDQSADLVIGHVQTRVEHLRSTLY